MTSRLPTIELSRPLAITLFNTFLAYLLYNHSMQTLTAFETNVFLNLAPIGTAVLA